MRKNCRANNGTGKISIVNEMFRNALHFAYTAQFSVIVAQIHYEYYEYRTSSRMRKFFSSAFLTDCILPSTIVTHSSIFSRNERFDDSGP